MSNREGVDIASFQGTPATWQPHAGNISWAAVKISEYKADGTRYINPYAAADWAYLAQHKLGRIGYLFAHPASSATGTVDLFLAKLNALGLKDTDGIAVDLEVTDGRTAAQVAAWAANVTNLLHKRAHRLPLLYTYLSFADAGNCAGLGHLPLWMSDPSSPAGKPRVPHPWKTWAVHQYSAGGVIDRDVIRWGSAETMQHELGKHAAQARQPEVVNYKCDGKLSLRQIASRHQIHISEVLRLTAVADGKFAANFSPFLNDVLDGTKPVSSPVPAGVVLKVPGVSKPE